MIYLYRTHFQATASFDTFCSFRKVEITIILGLIVISIDIISIPYKTVLATALARRDRIKNIGL